MRWKLLLPMWAQMWIISISQIKNWPLHWYHDLLKGAQAWSHLALWVMIWSPIAWIAFVSAFTHPTLVFRDETSIIPSLFRFFVPINLKFQLWNRLKWYWSCRDELECCGCEVVCYPPALIFQCPDGDILCQSCSEVSRDEYFDKQIWEEKTTNVLVCNWFWQRMTTCP